MANVPKYPHSSKEHPILSNEEEKSEEMLLQAEAANREFYTEAARVSADVTFLRSGVREKVARALMMGVGGLNPLQQRTLEEKVQTHLYREVQGNEINVTERGEDFHNYLQSENVMHMNASLPRRMGRQLLKVLRGTGAMIGTNNIIEAAVDRRFGANQDVQARRDFVANRLGVQLNMVLTGNPVLYGTIVAFLNGNPNIMAGLPAGAPVNLVQNFFAGMNLLQLRLFRNWANANGLPNLVNGQAFSDLYLLVNVAQQESSNFGIAEVYNEARLRRFWSRNPAAPNTLAAINVIPPGGGPPRPFTEVIEGMLEPNSLFPLENNPEGAAFLAELRNRIMNQAIMAGLANNAIPPQVFQSVMNDIRDIAVQETARGQVTQQDIERVNNLRAEVRQLIGEVRALSTHETRRAELLVNLAAVAAGTPAWNRLNSELNTLNNTILTASSAVNTRAADILNLLRGIPDLIPLNNSINIAAATANFLSPPQPAGFLAGLAANLGLVVNQVNNHQPQGQAVRFTPFVLLQRLLRRDYMRENNLPNNLYNEEANRYALMKAALRVEDVKSVDIRRTANAQAAEILNRGLLSRGWNKLKYAVAKGQDIIGLEPIDFANITADKMLEAIIGSREEYAPFSGMDKFTTSRDLKQLINKSGRRVSRETLERFSLTLAEAISRYKKAHSSLDKGLDPRDWDLENLLAVFKKVKVELWSREFLDSVERTSEPGQRELTLVRMLRESRIQERRLERTILDDVKDENANWRILLAKNSLKQVLDKDTLDGRNKIRQAGLEQKRKEIADLEAARNALPENDPGREPLNRQIQTIRDAIAVFERQVRDAGDLYDRVEKARTYIRENHLSRNQKREYLEAVGLTQVFDKMSTNFRMQRAWHYTKKGASAMWSGTKKTWAWSRKKFINAPTAKSAARKTFSVGRLLATPVTVPLGWAGFSFRLVGRAMRRTLQMPKRMAGLFSKSVLRSYYRDRIMERMEWIDENMARIGKQRKKLPNAPYSWDKRRIAKKINKFTEENMIWNEQIARFKVQAAKHKIGLGPVTYYSKAASDNGEIVDKAA